jgi:hypothetical protein
MRTSITRGAFAYLKQQFGARMAVMKDDVPAMKSGLCVTN